MKRNRRILSLLLAICLVAALIPAMANAESFSTVENVKDDEIVSFAGKDWLVMSNNADGMVLLLKTPEAPIAYNASGLSNDWNASDAKAWCESEEVREWFSNPEWNALSSDKVYFLSHEEVLTYFANNTLADLKTENGWWLRYDGENVGGNLFGIAVSDAGFAGTPHVATNYGARPAIMIPAENIAMTQSEGGKWALKVVDGSAFAGFSADVDVAGSFQSATINYSGVASGKISVVLTDRVGEILSYDSYDAAGASGTINHTLPADLMGWYTIRVFNEVDNADFVSAVVKHSFNVEDSHGEVIGYEATVKGDISINFAIDIKDSVKNDEGAYVVITTTSGTKQVKVSDLSESEHQEADASLLVNVTAPQMNDSISIQVYDSEGNSGAKQTFTIREYAEAIIDGNYADKDKNLAKHMLNYGAMSQIYFGYNANDLANKNIGKVEVAGVPNDGDSAATTDPVDGISFYGTSLVMNSKISLRFYFTLDDGADIKDYKFSTGYPAPSGTLKVDGVNKRAYRIEIENIAPNMLAKDYSVTITKGNATTSVTISPLDYVQRQFHATTSQSLKNMLQALYNYHLVALEHTPVA